MRHKFILLSREDLDKMPASPILKFSSQQVEIAYVAFMSSESGIFYLTSVFLFFLTG